MSETVPHLDAVERAALDFLVQQLNRRCKTILTDALNAFLCRECGAGAGLRTDAVWEYFLTLGIVRRPTAPVFPRPNDEFGEWTESEKQAIRAYHLQRDVALNQWVITGKAVEVFKTVAARRTTYGKKAKVHSIPQQYKKAARLWPTFKAEKKKDRRRAHFKGFRAWLQKRSHPILLDDRFEKWWASHTRHLNRLSK